MMKVTGENEEQLVYKRRGKDLKSIFIPHDLHTTDFNEIQTPKELSDFLTYITSPKDELHGSKKGFNFDSNPVETKEKAADLPVDVVIDQENMDVKLKDVTENKYHPCKGCGENKCSNIYSRFVIQNKHLTNITKVPQLSPSCIANDFSEYLDDIRLENLSSPNKYNGNIKKPWLKSDCCTSHAKNIVDALSCSDDKMLVLPKSSNLITPNTPIVLKRKNEMNVYFPNSLNTEQINQLTPKIISSLAAENDIISSLVAENGIKVKTEDTMFPFPPPNNNHKDIADIMKMPKVSFDQSDITDMENVSFDLNLNQPIGNDNPIDKTENVSKSSRSKMKRKHTASSLLNKTRDFHNKLERMRRGQQYERFQKLREVVPSMKNKPKAPKISILQGAITCIRQLREQEMLAKETIILEKRQNNYLLKQLCYLTKSMQAHNC